MAAAVVSTAVGLYVVLNQDTGAHHDDHEHAHTEKHDDEPAEEEGSEDTKTDEQAQAKDESNKQGADEEKDAPANRPTNSLEEERRSPDKTDKVGNTGCHPSRQQTNCRQPDPRKEETKTQNETSGKQKGLSNDDTHHTSQISKQPEKSKKGEGVAESAKLQGTVSTDRPGVRAISAFVLSTRLT